MAVMKDPRGKKHDIVPAGVAALESLGWTVVEPDRGDDDTTKDEQPATKDERPATKRTTRSRAKSD